MAYSRWSNSRWYTYWLASPSEETRDTAVFVIDSVASFSAKELRDDMRHCMAKVRAIDDFASDMQIEELRGYANEFLQDIDEEYPVKTP